MAIGNGTESASVKLDPASFKDPSGQVFTLGDRVFRSVSRFAQGDYEYVRDSGFLQRAIDRGQLIDCAEATPEEPLPNSPAYVIEHPRLPLISYPYEWPFSLLKSAALHHLDLQLDALEHDIALSDSSAYNIQFRGITPVFIDLLSLRRYRNGEFWAGHRQFCEQFLNPLLLHAYCGVAHNPWFRGNLEGIPTDDLNRLLPFWRKLSWNVLSHVSLLARTQSYTMADRERAIARAASVRLSKVGYQGILQQLRSWIRKLSPRPPRRSPWADYPDSCIYASEEKNAKMAVVSKFVRNTGAGVVWDLGCNTGEYSEVALEAGASLVVGFENDPTALEKAVTRARNAKLAFTPLYSDAANPSPNVGWQQRERRGLTERARCDAVLALAFIHHLVIGRNIPLEDVIDWITWLAPRGIIEFVQKDDPTIKQMLALREDIFEDYSQSTFEAALSRRAKIVGVDVVSGTGRRLYGFSRAA